MESEVHGKFQLGMYKDEVKIRSTFSIKSKVEGYSFLVWKDTDEEVVLDVTAFVAACELPPIMKKTRSVNLYFSVAYTYVTDVCYV
jgi:hypothetical protein